MILSDLPELKEGPAKSIISVYYSTWNLLGKAYVKTSVEYVLVVEFIPECTVGPVYSLRGCLSRGLGTLPSPNQWVWSGSFGLLTLSVDGSWETSWRKSADLSAVRDHERCFVSWE